MSLFLAAGAALLILATVLAQRLRAAERRDTLGLRAARKAAIGAVLRRVYADRLARLDRLRVPRSFTTPEAAADGRRRLHDFHREDR